MPLTDKYLKEKSIFNQKIGRHTMYRFVLNEPAGKILDIVRKGRYYYEYVGSYDYCNNPITLMSDLKPIKDLDIT